ncbi:MAG: hypothetical protein ABIP16_05495, partial [Thermomonas sp.]
MSLLAELKRRNVIRAAGLYLVGAWLLVQVAGTVLPWFDVPQANLRGLVLVLAVAFLPAMIISWVFELTPSGLRRDEDVPAQDSMAPQNAKRMDRLILIVAIIGIGYFAFDKFVLAPGRDAVLVTQTAAHVTAKINTEKSKLDPRSIAVLPFINMSQDKDNEYFSDGISEELLNVLVRVQGFNVASRTSSFAFKGRELGTTEIAKALKVKYILEGSVRKQGDQVRITAQLIDAASDRHLMSQTYDRKLADIFKIQDEIANAIVTAVRGSVDDTSRGKAVTVAADTSNLDAYQSYLKARELFLARTSLEESMHLFEHAVELDPRFARAWEGLSALYSIAPGWGITDRDYDALAAASAKRAIALDPERALAWAVLGQNETNAKIPNWQAGLALLDRAVKTDPRNTTAILWRSMTWMELGYFERAIADQDLCIRLEPKYLHCSTMKATSLLFVGRTRESLGLYEHSLMAGATQHHQFMFLMPRVMAGEQLEALTVFQLAGMDRALAIAMVAGLSDRTRQPQRIDALVAAIRSRLGSTPEELMFDADDGSYRVDMCLWLRDFYCLANAPKVSAAFLEHWMPGIPGLRASAGFKRVLDKLNVPAYWRAHGYPPQCHAVGANDFTC